jgi:ribonuclease HII
VKRRAPKLFQFDKPYLARYGLVAGVDEAGRGPLAGPVVASAVILLPRCRLPGLNDSKLLSAAKRSKLYGLIERAALAVGVGVISPEEIDRLNIRQASFAAMRVALEQLAFRPSYVLVDGFRIPGLAIPQTAIIGGDGKSACVAAASVIAKVTRDLLMEARDRQLPGYGFRQHKGYGTAAHLAALRTLGPSPIHRRTFAPVRELAGNGVSPQGRELPVVSPH